MRQRDGTSVGKLDKKVIRAPLSGDAVAASASVH
jgi:hypothetical protein